MGEKIATALGVIFWIAVLFGLPVYSVIAGNSNSSESSIQETPATTDYSTEASDTYDVDSEYSDYESYESGSYDYDSSYDDYDYNYDSEYDSSNFDNYDYNESYNASTDLDCSDFGYEHYVGSYDPHGLDGDGDGYACESY